MSSNCQIALNCAPCFAPNNAPLIGVVRQATEGPARSVALGLSAAERAGDAWTAGSGRSVAVFESPAGVAGFDDIAVVGEPVEHGGGHLGVAEHLGPIGEGEDVDTTALRCIGDVLERRCELVL